MSVACSCVYVCECDYISVYDGVFVAAGKLIISIINSFVCQEFISYVENVLCDQGLFTIVTDNLWCVL